MSNSVRPHRWQPTRLPRPWDTLNNTKYSSLLPLNNQLKKEETEGRRRGQQAEMAGWDHKLNMSLSKLWETVKDNEAWHAAVHKVAKSRHNFVTEQQQKFGVCWAQFEK